MKRIKHVLFICLGNTARSPVAEYLARDYAVKFKENLEFDSCGFINAFGYMQPESREYLDNKGIFHSDFVPKIVDLILLEKQDIILTMESEQSSMIKKNFNSIRNIKKKTFTLKEFNGETQDLDIIDPYYTSKATYRQVLKVIDDNVEKAVKRIIKINKS